MSSTDKHYNPIIASRLRSFADGRQWCELMAYLDTLSNAQFRTAGYILGDEILPKLCLNDFWTLLTLLYNYNAKAFLVTGMKATKGRVDEFSAPEAEELWKLVSENELDASKALQTVLPFMTDEVELARHMLNAMVGANSELRIAILLRIPSTLAAFLLLHALRQVEQNRALLVRTTYFLMKRGDALSFNLASLLKVFFGLDEIKGTFSLRLQPYELARLETSYEAFKAKIEF